MSGGGHGTLIFVVPLLTLLAFSAAILMLKPAAKPIARILAVVLVLFHYLATLLITYPVESGDGFAHTFTVLKYSPISFALATVWYLTGNAVFWKLLLRTRTEPSTAATPIHRSQKI